MYQQLGIAGATYTKDDLTNIDVVPLTLFNHKGIVHWYYELQVETLGTGYDAGAPLNVGQHNIVLRLPPPSRSRRTRARKM